MTVIDVSAQIGGLDAEPVLLPHFFALKSALQGRSFEGFPLRELAFILRVDGEVSTYGLSGPGNIDFDKKGQWVSVDIGITSTAWVGRKGSEISDFVANAILASVDLLKEQERLEPTDWGALETTLESLCVAYKAQFSSGNCSRH
jgi:hypothetical protein